MVRTTGFGQTGPYSDRARASGRSPSRSRASPTSTACPDGPPTLPPFALGDGVAALTGAFATMFALWWREHAGDGKGQVIDLSIYEPLFWILGPQALVYDQLGIVQDRTGNRAPFTAPRNAYQAKDGRWLGLSASAQSIAERVMKLVGRADLIDEPWFADHTGRLEHAGRARRVIRPGSASATADEVLEAFAEQRRRDRADLLDRRHLRRIRSSSRARRSRRSTHPKLGPLQMQNVIPRLARRPAASTTPGPSSASTTTRSIAVSSARRGRTRGAPGARRHLSREGAAGSFTEAALR